MEFWEKPEYYCPKRDKCKHGKICDNRGLFRGEYLCFERAYDCYSVAIENQKRRKTKWKIGKRKG